MSLKTYRTKAGITQASLSDKTGINMRTLQHYEQGSRDIKKASGETIYKLAKALGCSMEELLK